MLNKLTIIAPGLLGASIAMASRERSLAKRIAIWSRRQESVDALADKNWCDHAGSDLDSACIDSDLIIVCAPVKRIIELCQRIAPNLNSNPIVTDVGSVKADIVTQCSKALSQSARFVGSHPMAGSEKTGMEHAMGNLFEKKTCFVTPTALSDQAAVERVSEFWKQLGSVVSSESPEEHDRIVANVSHLPHIVASTIAGYLSKSSPGANRVCGNGLKDTTRIASGSPSIWREIITQNRSEIMRSLDAFQADLSRARETIEHGSDDEIESFLQTGKTFRDSLNT